MGPVTSVYTPHHRQGLGEPFQPENFRRSTSSPRQLLILLFSGRMPTKVCVNKLKREMHDFISAPPPHIPAIHVNERNLLGTKGSLRLHPCSLLLSVSESVDSLMPCAQSGTS